jgi:squalene synthase HpnC
MPLTAFWALKLTSVSGDKHVKVCIKSSARAQIEIMTRDRAATEATLAHPRARTVLPASLAAAGPSEAAMAGKAAAENFPVALRMLPRRHRDHLMAVYSYARTVDDIGDEGAPEQRLALLADLEEDVRRLYAQSGSGTSSAGRPRDPSVRGLASVVMDCGIPMQPFLDLIKANQQDQLVTRYETFEELLGYCTLSANPVGRIVLYVFGCSTPEREQLSDSICTGLQIVEHLQDVAEDFQAGRVYLPAEDLRSHGCTEEDLAGSTAPPQLRRLIKFETARTGSLISEGAPLVGQLRGAARAAVAGYLAGGRAAMAAIAAADYDVLAATPKPAKSRTVRELASAMLRGR